MEVVKYRREHKIQSLHHEMINYYTIMHCSNIISDIIIVFGVHSLFVWVSSDKGGKNPVLLKILPHSRLI